MCSHTVTRAKILVLALVLTGTGVGQGASPINGEYVGLEKMPNISPEETGAKWFHENTLFIRNNELILDMVPVVIEQGEKIYSASDGGFLTYRGRFFERDGHIFVALRLFESDYIIYPVSERQKHYREVKTYPVKFESGTIEINSVQYKPKLLEDVTRKRYMELLKREPVERK